ncbi:DUF4124 domain-containing protein [Francisellaceae bacterium CB300]
MKLYKKLTFLFGTLIISTATGYAQGNIYTWQDARGNTVFSQTAPIFEEAFQEVRVRGTSRSHSESSPILAQLYAIKENNLYIEHEEVEPQDTIKDHHKRETINVRIISPASGERMFAHGHKLAVTLEPRLMPYDNPIFIVNSIPIRGHYENGTWMIYRPNPGPVDISVRGTTRDHKIINSTKDTQIFIRSVLGR